MAAKSRALAGVPVHRKRTRQRRASTLRRLARGCGRVARAVVTVPPAAGMLVWPAAILATLLAVNWTYQVIRKPTELFFPVSERLAKSPAQTWQAYGPLFTRHSTPVITAELLAAIAQAESSGNPLARTYWRWRPTEDLFEMYQPASSAVGMYQMTDGTFQEARRYCIHGHAVAEEGPWHDLRSCWFNDMYARAVPSHAIELTAAYLDRAVARAMLRRPAGATLDQQQDLAALIHLCGARAGGAYAARGFRLKPRRRCGDHDVKRYLTQVNKLKSRFAKLAAAG
jgi:hypothetical protein